MGASLTIMLSTFTVRWLFKIFRWKCYKCTIRTCAYIIEIALSECVVLGFEWLLEIIAAALPHKALFWSPNNNKSNVTRHHICSRVLSSQTFVEYLLVFFACV